jgi:hypothetical protein
MLKVKEYKNSIIINNQHNIISSTTFRSPTPQAEMDYVLERQW